MIHDTTNSIEPQDSNPLADLVFPMTIIAAWIAEDGKIRVQDQGGGALPLDYASALTLRNALNEYLSYGDGYITEWRAAFLAKVEETKHEYTPRPKAPEKGYVYLIKRDGLYKIGITKSIKSRISQMKTSSATPIELICEKFCDDMLAVETALHIQFADKRVRGEWFDLSPEDVEYIKGLAQ